LVCMGLLAILSMTGCHKVCTCIGYNSYEYEFTPEEVDEIAGGDCSAMSDFPIANHYSYCHW